MLDTHVNQKRVFVRMSSVIKKQNKNKTLHIQGKNLQKLKYKSININYKNFSNSSLCLE